MLNGRVKLNSILNLGLKIKHSSLKVFLRIKRSYLLVIRRLDPIRKLCRSSVVHYFHIRSIYMLLHYLALKVTDLRYSQLVIR